MELLVSAAGRGFCGFARLRFVPFGCDTKTHVSGQLLLIQRLQGNPMVLASHLTLRLWQVTHAWALFVGLAGGWETSIISMAGLQEEHGHGWTLATVD